MKGFESLSLTNLANYYWKCYPERRRKIFIKYF